jgi:hypothetical protein
MTDILEHNQIVKSPIFSGTAAWNDRTRQDIEHSVATAREGRLHSEQVVVSGVSTSSGPNPVLRERGLEWRSVLLGAGTKDTPFVWPKQDEQEFNIVISRILQLLRDEDELHPTDYALRTALATIYEANQILRGVFVRAAVAVDEDGSIIFYWKSPVKNLNLTIPAQSGSALHIYHREGNEYGGERNASVASLAQWLRWYMQA